MQTPHASIPGAVPPCASFSASKQKFRRYFQRSLRACLRRHFSLQEAFGVIFEETLQEVPLTAAEESELFEELLAQAGEGQELFPGYSARLFTEFPRSAKENSQPRLR